MAEKVNVPMLYMSIARYTLASEIKEVLNSNDRNRLLSGEDGELDCLRERITDRASAWRKYEGTVFAVVLCWVKESVIHSFERFAPWHEECFNKICEVVEEALDIEAGNRKSLEDQELANIHAKAQQMVQHERFAEARSEAKREFMARQLFPNDELGAQKRIAMLASLYHWWFLEPEEEATTEEKVKELDEQGYRYREIAKLLNISMAKTRRILGINI